ncbi:MAG TPA: glycerophosphodiester phosphodiesterase family protein [Steroidobacteraceae bacterium]|jgi:glycerophosphoryl diester phosphodiesterase
MPGPLTHRLIHLIAHRGNARDYPENTLPALRSAVELGVRFLEFDVHLSADGVPIVIHDHELTRTAGLPGSVFEYPVAELRQVEVNEPGRLGARFQGVHIPTLADVVEFLKERHEITAFVEIKRASLRRFGHEQVVARVLDVLKPVRSRCVVISFDLPAVHMARQHGSFAIGWVLSDYDGHARLKFEALKPEFLFCDHEKLPAGGERLWRGPWRWAVYEVETVDLALSLAERGADFIETMAVASMIQAFRNLAVRAAQGTG